MAKRKRTSSQLDLFTPTAPSPTPSVVRQAAPAPLRASNDDARWKEDRKLKCCGKSVLRTTHGQQPHIEMLYCQVEKRVTGNVYDQKEVIWGRR